MRRPGRGAADLPAVLGPRLAQVLPPLGVAWTPRLPVPRRTMLDWYFRAGGIDGMTNPFGLEVLLNSRVLPVELPALVAHEYAHLAGFADEADASVVAWLACQGGVAGAALQRRARGAAAPADRPAPRDAARSSIDGLDEGPRDGPAGDRGHGWPTSGRGCTPSRGRPTTAS